MSSDGVNPDSQGSARPFDQTGAVQAGQSRRETQEVARQNYHSEVADYRCPSCQAKLREESVICTNCGFNLMSGKTMDPKVSTEGNLMDKVQGFLRSFKKK